MLLDTTFTTMGSPASIAGWNWQEWHLTIDEGGCVHQHIQTKKWRPVTTSNRGAQKKDEVSDIQEDRYYVLNVKDREKLFNFIVSQLNELPETLGTFATDSDCGKIDIREENYQISVTLIGGGFDAPKDQVSRFYNAINKLLARFPITHS